MGARNRRPELRGGRERQSGLNPAASPTRSTYQPPAVLVQQDNDFLQVARALSGLSPSLAAYADRAVVADRQQDEREVDQFVSALDARQARFISLANEQEIEERFPELKGSGVGRHIVLQEQIGRQIAVREYRNEALEGLQRFQDPTNHDDPSAYLAELGQQYVAGMGSLASGSFAEVKNAIDNELLTGVADTRRTRLVQANRRAAVAEVANIIERSMQGKAFDADAMSIGLEEYRTMTGDDPAEVLFTALDHTTVSRVTSADSPADEFDDAIAAITEAREWSNFGELYDSELDALESRLSELARTTEIARANEDAVRESRLIRPISELMAQATAERWDEAQLSEQLTKLYTEAGVFPTVHADLELWAQRKRKAESARMDDPKAIELLMAGEASGSLSIERVNQIADSFPVRQETREKYLQVALEGRRNAELLEEMSGHISELANGLGLNEEAYSWAPFTARAQLHGVTEDILLDVNQQLFAALEQSDLTSTAKRKIYARSWVNTRGRQIIQESKQTHSELFQKINTPAAAAATLVREDTVVQRSYHRFLSRLDLVINEALDIDPDIPLDPDMAQTIEELRQDADSGFVDRLASYLESTPGREMNSRQNEIEEGLGDRWAQEIFDEISGASGELSEDRSALGRKAEAARMKLRPNTSEPVSISDLLPDRYRTPREIDKAIDAIARIYESYTDGDVAARPESFREFQERWQVTSDAAFEHVGKLLTGSVPAFTQREGLLGSLGSRSLRSVRKIEFSESGVVIPKDQNPRIGDHERQALSLTASLIYLKLSRGLTLDEIKEKKLSFTDSAGNEHSFKIDPGRLNPRYALLYSGPDEFLAATEEDHRARLNHIPRTVRPASVEEFRRMQHALLVKRYSEPKLLR